MRQRRLPAGGANVFQLVRAKRAEAQGRGIELLDLSIGEPRGAALLSAREAARDAVMSDAEAMHAYQYNLSPGVPGFAERFVAGHLDRDISDQDVAYLPIPGIKPILGVPLLACGGALAPLTVGTMTKPGYPIPADWCGFLHHVTNLPLPTSSANAFRFTPADIAPGTGLLMINYPHNPSGQIATRDWLSTLCQHCAEHDIRLFNDAAYTALAHTDENATLTEVAVDFPELSWAEAFTAAKLIGNGTGWHVGAMVGSPDFIADMAEIKGKIDSGHVAPMAAGALAALEDDQASIAAGRETYRRRLDTLVTLMRDAGMRLAIEPSAGFYALWEVPTQAFGKKMDSAETFNFAMIEETGVVGVHFPGYVRYAVCANIDAIADKLRAAFTKAAPSYD